MAKKKTKKSKTPKGKAKKKTITDKLKITELSASLSGVIPVASYENLRPHFTITTQPKARTKVNAHKAFDYMEGILHDRFAMVENKAKTDVLARQYSAIRFYLKKGRRYPSVTSILDVGKDFHIPEHELRQYAARGKIVDKLVQIYFETNKWKDPMKIPSLKEEVSILLGGSLEMHWTDCSYEKFFKHYKKRINIERMKTVVFNEEHFYAGELDAIGEFEGKCALIDFKTGDFDMRQLAAYAICEKGIENLVVFPVGPTDNVCGYKRPVVCDTIQEMFREFLKARGEFKERFGI